MAGFFSPDLLQNINFLHLICYHKLKNGAFEFWLQRWSVLHLPNHHNLQRLKRAYLGGN